MLILKDNKATGSTVTAYNILEIHTQGDRTVDYTIQSQFGGGCLKPAISGNIQYMDIAKKSELKLLATYFKDDQYMIGRLKDYPEIFTEDQNLTDLKKGLLDSFSLYYEIDIDKIDATIEIHEDKELKKTFE